MAMAANNSERPSAHWRTARSLPIENWQVQRWRGETFQTQNDPVAIEEPFEIRLNGRNLAVIMRTPGDSVENDRELAVGFLLTEGVIDRPTQIKAIVRTRDDDGLPAENVLDVQLHEPLTGFFHSADVEEPTGDERFERRFVVGSSCGICGKNSIEDACRRLPPLPAETGQKIKAATLYQLPDRLRAAQAVFDQTGGLHAAGLFDRAGQLLLLREDIGRHNAVDKLIGRSALDGQFPLSDQILLVSGRTSFEIIQKALAARLPVVAAVSAPSTLAIQLAQEGGITLIGFLRGPSMNVYTHPARLEA